MTLQDLEGTLRRLRLPEPSPEMRRRILDACAARSHRWSQGAGWAAWRFELALAASVALLLAAVLAAGSPAASPPTATTPVGTAIVPWPLLPDWPPEIPRIENRLVRELEAPLATTPSQGEPPC